LNTERDQNGLVRLQSENGRPVSSACGSIEGRVVRADSNAGIANAHVTLGPPGERADVEILETVTDSTGRFIFPSLKQAYPLPDGYRVRADADGYQSATFGAVGSSEFAETIALTGGMHFHADFKLNPYQTASGIVRTADGLPVAAARVRAYRVRYSLLGRRMKIVKSAFTNDLGEFRLSGMEPGDYYFSASYSELAREVPLLGATLTPNLSNPDAGYITEYFPAAVSPPNAALIAMVPNIEKTNLNFVLQDVERFKVRVRVFAASNAQSHHFNIAMMPEGAELEDAEEYVVHRAEQTDGSDFEIRDVGVGHYSLVAFDKARILSEPTAITVDHDIEAGVTVYDPVDVPGDIVDEGGAPVSGKWGVRLVRVDPAIGQTIRVNVETGSFVVPDLGPAAYDVYVDGLPLGTYIKDVQFPVNDGPMGRFGRIRIEPERPKRIQDPDTLRWRTEASIRVVLAHSDLIVVGIVSTGPMVPPGISGAQLILEPEREPQSPYAFREDRFITGRSGGGGFFRWVGVPEGVYSMYAYTEIPPGLYFDSEFHDRISNKGTRGSVRPGAIPDRIFEMHGCQSPPPYIDPIYRIPDFYNPVPPPDAPCLTVIPREESIGVFR
jgi:hypothetical protein